MWQEEWYGFGSVLSFGEGGGRRGELLGLGERGREGSERFNTSFKNCTFNLGPTCQTQEVGQGPLKKIETKLEGQ